MNELTTAGLVVGVEAEECNKIIRVQAVQVKEEMEEPNATTTVQTFRHVSIDVGKQQL